MTKRGIGNGISLLIFASILSSAPAGITAWINGGPLEKLFFPLVAIGVVVAVVFVQEGQRRIPIQYAKWLIRAVTGDTLSWMISTNPPHTVSGTVTVTNLTDGGAALDSFSYTVTG